MKPLIATLMIGFVGCATSQPLLLEESYDRFQDKTELQFNQQITVWETNVLGLTHSLGLYPFWRSGEENAHLYLYYNKPSTDGVPDYFTDVNARLFLLVDGKHRWQIQREVLWSEFDTWYYRHGFLLPKEASAFLATANRIEIRFGSREVTLAPEAVSAMNEFFSAVVERTSAMGSGRNGA